VILEGREGPTGTAVFDSAVAESTPFPKVAPKVVGGGKRLAGRNPVP
jgi:hypothetical protein